MNGIKLRSVETIAHLYRYGISGFIIYVADLLIFSMVIWFDQDYYQQANVTGKAIAGMLGLVLHKHYTFHDVDQDNPFGKQATQYVLLLLMNTLLSAGLLFLLIEHAALSALSARIFTDIAVVFTAFVISKTIIFR